jgi:FAD/FMN-containing dehydrogenase
MSMQIKGFTGEIVLPDDRGYHQLRSVWNAMHDRRPSVILRCRDRDDVIAAIACARDAGLEIAIRGGGHSIPGYGVCEGGVVIDMRLMNGVEVDPVARRAVVAGGAMLRDVDQATQRHGLLVPAGVVSHTGLAGLTLGGGVGRLMRRFGLTVDSVRAAEVVTADGQVRRASADEYPDLFWAIRGGGGNFGVVTSFEFDLHELSEVVVLQTFHDLADAQQLLGRAQREIGGGAPDEFLWTSFVRKGHDLPWMPADAVGKPGILSSIEWSGPPDVGLKLLGQLRREIAPVGSTLDVVPFEQIQQADDELMHHGLLSYIKASFTDRLGPELIEVIVDRARLLGSHLTQIELLSMGAAISRVPVENTAFAHRQAQWLVNILATWHHEADSDYEIEWSRQSHAAIAPLTSGGAYVNFMDGDEGSSEWTAYGPTLERLQRVKAAYDPDNVFHLNQNIAPASAG